MTRSIFNRRQFLRASGVTLALPFLESLTPRGLALHTNRQTPVPRRMVCICNDLGLHLPFFIPEGTGRNYRPSRYTNIINDLRDHFTVFSGVSHPEVDGGHSAEKSFLTTAPHPAGASFRNTISLDQFAVDHIGRETRFPSLVLTANGRTSLSYTRAGVPIPGATRPSQVFARLFFNGTPAQVQQRVQELQMGQSIMDTVLGQANSVVGKLNGPDRELFDQYVTSVREVEQQMVRQQEWETRPRPRVNAQPPRDITDQGDVIGRARLMFDLTRLALQTDSTRLITIMMQGFFIVPPIEGVDEGYHTLSHHGQNRNKIEQLALIETEQMRVLGDLLRGLHTTREQGDTLLDRTMVMYGSNLGNASSHDTRNMPIILAGGGFRHGQHLAFDRDNNYPLPNLFVSMLQRLGIEVDRFGSSTGTMRGLEMA